MSAESTATIGGVALGRQMTIEFYDCKSATLTDAAALEKVFLRVAELSGAHVVDSVFHSFQPQGVSGVVVISESHFAVHAWPEHDYAAVDLFTCGSGVDFDVAVKALAEGMNSGCWIISSLVNRGILGETGVERLVPVVENQRSCGMQLSSQADLKVLDCCAAPGGKSFAAAIAMAGKGSIVSCDIHPHKVTLIQNGACRLGLENITAQVQDASRNNPAWNDQMDVVIADVPCSGYGIIRKKPDIRYKDPASMETSM